MKVLSIFFLLLAFIGVILNARSGWILSENSGSSSDFHLIVGILTLASTLMGAGFVLFLFSKRIDEVKKKIVREDLSTEALKPYAASKDIVTQLCIASMVLSLISLISGTISHSGQFPLLHGLLGFILAFCIFLILAYWIRFLIRSSHH